MADYRPEDDGRVSRRSFISSAGAAAAGTVHIGRRDAAAQEPAESTAETPGVKRYAPSGQTITLEINGAQADLPVTPATTLLQAIRETHGLTGAKEVCDRGACGACTVLVDGRSVNSCMMLAIDAIGRPVTTVEGLARDGRLDPVQQSYIDEDACQCGFCIPGFVVRSRALLDETPRPSRDEIKQGLSGNICRCAAYAAIFAAVERASKEGES